MIVTFSPQRSDGDLRYGIDGDVVQVERDGETETLDFSGADDGIWHDLDGVGLDRLGVVMGARREAGTVHVTLLSLVGPDASEAARFPQPVEVPAQVSFIFPQEA